MFSPRARHNDPGQDSKQSGKHDKYKNVILAEKKLLKVLKPYVSATYMASVLMDFSHQSNILNLYLSWNYLVTNQFLKSATNFKFPVSRTCPWNAIL